MWNLYPELNRLKQEREKLISSIESKKVFVKKTIRAWQRNTIQSVLQFHKIFRIGPFLWKIDAKTFFFIRIVTSLSPKNVNIYFMFDLCFFLIPMFEFFYNFSIFMNPLNFTTQKDDWRFLNTKEFENEYSDGNVRFFFRLIGTFLFLLILEPI